MIVMESKTKKYSCGKVAPPLGFRIQLHFEFSSASALELKTSSAPAAGHGDLPALVCVTINKTY